MQVTTTTFISHPQASPSSASPVPWPERGPCRHVAGARSPWLPADPSSRLATLFAPRPAPCMLFTKLQQRCLSLLDRLNRRAEGGWVWCGRQTGRSDLISRCSASLGMGLAGRRPHWPAAGHPSLSKSYFAETTAAPPGAVF
jgi:hypothetical protein